MFEDIKDSGCCKFPFSVAEIDWDGNVYGCCAGYFIGYSFGNIFEQPFDEIWNGEKAQEFRKQFLEREFKHCNFSICPKEFSKSITPTLIAPYPKRVQLNYDSVCNARCIYCRDHHFRNDTSKFEEHFDDIIVPLLKNASLVNVTASGEIFASNYAKGLTQRITKIYPDLKFYIYTNGILCDEKHLKEYGIWDKVDYFVVSLPAITEKTYNKIVLEGDFKKVIKNIKFLGKLKKENKISNLIINFVVTSLNYKEMPKMAKFAKNNHATISFVKLNKLENNKTIYDSIAIANPEHPEHEEYLKVLRQPIFTESFINKSTTFDEIREK